MIDQDDIERLKYIFVTRQECDSNNAEINDKLSNDSTELALIKAQLATITWVAKTTLAAVIGLLVTYVVTNIL